MAHERQLELAGKLAPKDDRVGRRTAATRYRGGRAVGTGKAADQHQLFVVELGERADWRPAAATGRREERPLRLDGGARRSVVDRGRERDRPRIVAADLDRERALAGRRRH